MKTENIAQFVLWSLQTHHLHKCSFVIIEAVLCSIIQAAPLALQGAHWETASPRTQQQI